VQVCDKGKWFISSKDVPKSHRNVVLPSMFPNGGSYQDVGDSNCNIIIEGDINTDDVKGHTEEDVQAVENPVMLEFTEEDSDFPLERCMRFVPHDQNTGAFFIAVLQKVSDLPGKFFYDFSCFSLSNIGKESQGILVDIGNNSSFKQSVLITNIFYVFMPFLAIIGL